MKAMILAAGFGTRLRPLTNQTPKPLLSVGGYPLLEWNLLLLRQYGFRDIMINLHYLGQQIETTFGNGSRLALRISYSWEKTILGTGGGIKQAEAFFEGEPFLVMNGDTLCEVNLEVLRQVHAEQEAIATMVVREDPHAEQWGPIDVTQGNRVQKINGIGRHSTESHRTFMFAGLHIMHPQLLQDVPEGQETSIIDAYQRMLAKEKFVAAFPFSGYWSDVGTLERYEQAQQDVEAKQLTIERRLQER